MVKFPCNHIATYSVFPLRDTSDPPKRGLGSIMLDACLENGDKLYDENNLETYIPLDQTLDYTELYEPEGKESPPEELLPLFGDIFPVLQTDLDSLYPPNKATASIVAILLRYGWRCCGCVVVLVDVLWVNDYTVIVYFVNDDSVIVYRLLILVVVFWWGQLLLLAEFPSQYYLLLCTPR